MGARTESAVSIVAAFFVLFSAMIDPRVAAGLAVVFLLCLGGYKLVTSR